MRSTLNWFCVFSLQGERVCSRRSGHKIKPLRTWMLAPCGPCCTASSCRAACLVRRWSFAEVCGMFAKFVLQAFRQEKLKTAALRLPRRLFRRGRCTVTVRDAAGPCVSLCGLDPLGLGTPQARAGLGGCVSFKFRRGPCRACGLPLSLSPGALALDGHHRRLPRRGTRAHPWERWVRPVGAEPWAGAWNLPG